MSSSNGGNGGTSGDEAKSFGDRYLAARSGAVVFDRPGRVLLEVVGRAPGQMLGGVVTGRIPGPLSEGRRPAGTRSYSAILTPKGKILSDLLVYRMPREDEAYLLDLPGAGAVAVRDHFRRVLPPRFARVEEASAAHESLNVTGPTAAQAVAGITGTPADVLAELGPDEVAVLDGTMVARSPDFPVPSFDLHVPSARWVAVQDAVGRLQLTSGGADVAHALRVEAGTPAFGADMTADTIPIEAGIEGRAIDHAKGCYTGQEVIVRILHRGHVNRYLRKLVLEAGADAPSAGAEIFHASGDKTVGWITSTAWSPLVERVVALGYVRREVAVGAEVRLGTAEGPAARVLELGAPLGE